MTFYWLNEWVKSLSPVWLFATPWTVSLPGSSVHGVFQARALEWAAIPFSRGSPRPRDRTRVSHIVGRRFTVWASGEVLTEYFLGKKRTHPSGVLCSTGRARASQFPSPDFIWGFCSLIFYTILVSFKPQEPWLQGTISRWHLGSLAPIHKSGWQRLEQLLVWVLPEDCGILQNRRSRSETVAHWPPSLPWEAVLIRFLWTYQFLKPFVLLSPTSD